MKKIIAFTLSLICVLVGCNVDKSNDDNPLFNETDITAVTTTNDNILETFKEIEILLYLVEQLKAGEKDGT